MIKETERIVIDKTKICDICGFEEDRTIRGWISTCPVCNTDICEECWIKTEVEEARAYELVCSEECKEAFERYEVLIAEASKQIDDIYEERGKEFDKITTSKGE